MRHPHGAIWAVVLIQVACNFQNQPISGRISVHCTQLLPKQRPKFHRLDATSDVRVEESKSHNHTQRNLIKSNRYRKMLTTI